jgi:hypothetical protein
MRGGLLNYCRIEEPPLDTVHCHRPHLRRLACRALCLEEGHEPGRCREAVVPRREQRIEVAFPKEGEIF